MARWIAFRREKTTQQLGWGDAVETMHRVRVSPIFEAADRVSAEAMQRARWPHAQGVMSVASLEAATKVDMEVEG